MALTQAERISISLKIVSIPAQNANSDKISAQIDLAIADAQKEDDGNKKLMDDITPFVNAYQTEKQRYNGDGHNQLTEQMMQDAANKTLQNFFFPNDPQTPLPSVTDGVWKFFPSFSGSAAVGKTYTEGFASVQNEQTLISDINTVIATIEGFFDATRSTGDECTEGIDPAPDIIAPSAAMQAAATDMDNAVQAWEDFINATYAIIPTAGLDPDATRLAQNDAARTDITDTVAIIDTWQAIQQFDTTTVPPITCAAFDAEPAANFEPSRYRDTELQPLKDEITARLAFVSTRLSQLTANLGSVTQNFTTGDITGATGFHGNRFRVIDMRLNLIGGSLNKLKGLQNGKGAQTQAKASNDNAAAVFTSVMIATGFRAPAAGTTTIHVLDATGFSASDSVFVMANDQQEISTTIVSITNNTVVLADTVPQKYRQDAGGRLYKVL